MSLSYKELAPMIMKATSLKVCRVSWQAGGPGGPMKSSRPEVGMLQTQEKPRFQSEFKDRKNIMSQLEVRQAGRRILSF